MKTYIQATRKDGEVDCFFVRHIKRVLISKDGYVAIVGCNNNGYVEVKEDLEYIMSEIEKVERVMYFPHD